MSDAEVIEKLGYILIRYCITGAVGLGLVKMAQTKHYTIKYTPDLLQYGFQHSTSLPFGGDTVIFRVNPVFAATLEATTQNLLTELAHETVHYCQICRGDVETLDSNQIKWKGTSHTLLPTTNITAYKAQPWEEEANAYAESIGQYVIMKLKEIRDSDQDAAMVLKILAM